MKTFGAILKQARKNKSKTLSDVFFDLKIDAAILSKIERGKRTATKKQVFDFITYFNLNEREAFSIWLSDKILKEYKNETYVLDAFRVAEEEVKYNIKKKESYSSSIKKPFRRSR